MRQGYEERSNSHDQTANRDQPWTMEFSTKVAHKGYYQHVAWEGEELTNKLMNHWLKGIG